MHEKYAKRIPYHAQRYFEEGTRFESQGNPVKALECYSLAISIFPDFADALLMRGNIYLRRKAFEKALEDISRCIEIEPREPRGYNSKGAVFHLRQEFAKAIKEYTLAVEANPLISGKSGAPQRNIFQSNYPEQLYKALHNRGIAYGSLGRFREAISDFSQVIELAERYDNDPDMLYRFGNEKTAAIYQLRGFAHEDSGEIEKAIFDYEKALALDPKLTSVKESLEYLKQAEGELQD